MKREIENIHQDVFDNIKQLMDKQGIEYQEK